MLLAFCAAGIKVSALEGSWIASAVIRAATASEWSAADDLGLDRGDQVGLHLVEPVVRDRVGELEPREDLGRLVQVVGLRDELRAA